MSAKHIQNGQPILQAGQNKLPSSIRFRSISDHAVWTRIHAVWWLAKEDIAIHKFTSYIRSQLLNNSMAAPTVYKDDKTAWEILILLAKYFRKLLQTRLMASPYYGIMADETTDVSTTQQLIIYIKFLDKGEDGLFKPTIEYLDLVSPKSGGAQDLKVTFICNDAADYYRPQYMQLSNRSIYRFRGLWDLVLTAVQQCLEPEMALQAS